MPYCFTIHYLKLSSRGKGKNMLNEKYNILLNIHVKIVVILHYPESGWQKFTSLVAWKVERGSPHLIFLVSGVLKPGEPGDF